MTNLTITKEKVLEAASKCSTAKATLRVLFPDIFKEEIEFDSHKVYAVISNWSGKIFKLNKGEGSQYVFYSMDSSDMRLFTREETAQDALKRAKSKGMKIHAFDNQKDFAKWLLENS